MAGKSQSPCTVRMAGICLPLGLRSVQGECQWHMKNSGNPPWLHNTHNYPKSRGVEVCPSLYWISQSQSCQHQPRGGHGSFPTDTPTATKLGLCSSLYWISQSQSCQHQPRGGHGSFPTDTPTATKLGLCSSLYWISQSQSCQHQPRGGHGSFPTDTPTATKLGLCSSLLETHLDIMVS